MKKIILGLGLGILMLSGLSTASALTSTGVSENFESEACRHGQCGGTAKSTGNRCRNCVSNAGDFYCGWHN